MSEPLVRTTSPFRLDGLVKMPLPGVCNRWLERLVEKVFGLSTLERLYHELPPSSGQQEFLQIVLDLFNIRYSVNQPSGGAVPATGAALLVANHPFGGLDGVLLAHHLLQQRADVKFMANYILGRIPELEDLFIGVDPFGGDNAKVANTRPLREALRWLKSGGVLVIFPAGEVSHLYASKRRVTDPEWSPAVARIVRATQTPVIPVCFEGANSVGFQLAGLMHPRLRTMLLPRELLNKEQRTFEMTIGKPIAAKRLASFETDSDLMRFLRLQTYSLYRGGARPSPVSPASGLAAQPIASAIDAELVAADIAALPQRQLLVDFLKAKLFDLHLSRLVRPKKPFKRLARMQWTASDAGSIGDLDKLSDLIAQIEADDKGVPILLKQYVKLGGRLLGFNVDPEFNNALDGLIMVDLRKTDLKTLQKYMGREEAQHFLEFHRTLQPEWRRAC